MMAKRVFLHSWHSQSVHTIAEALDEDLFGVLLSVDSHLDIHFVSTRWIELFPTELLKLAATRSAAHFQIRYVLSRGTFPWLPHADDAQEEFSEPTMFLAAPFGIFANMLSSVFDRLDVREWNQIIQRAEKHDPLIRPMPMQSVNDTMALLQEMRIQPHLSPPRTLMELTSHVNFEDVIFDIDVDYFRETQAECYSPIQNPDAGEGVGHLAAMMQLIRKVKPPLITISEMSVAALKNPTSMVTRFIRWLEKRGYQIERDGVFAEDESPKKALELYKRYWYTVERPHLDEIRRNIANPDEYRKLFEVDSRLQAKAKTFFAAELRKLEADNR
jgi:hypothetical protein